MSKDPLARPADHTPPGWRDAAELLLLAALWGASFILMRRTVPEFGPVPMIAVRVGLAAACMLPLLALGARWHMLRPHWPAVLLLGVINSALPFSLLAYATLHLTGGFTSILNATAPLWAALIAWLWLGEQARAARLVGLALGVIGVTVLVRGVADGPVGGPLTGVGAGLIATFLYGLSANFTRRHLSGLDPLAITTGSLIGATLVLAPAAVLLWPSQPVSAQAWLATLAMALGCTALAYSIYFRLIARIGPSRAIAVAFLVPLFAVIFGSLFLDEPLTATMAAGGLTILCGTALATGLLHPGLLSRPMRAD